MIIVHFPGECESATVWEREDDPGVQVWEGGHVPDQAGTDPRGGNHDKKYQGQLKGMQINTDVVRVFSLWRYRIIRNYSISSYFAFEF